MQATRSMLNDSRLGRGPGEKKAAEEYLKGARARLTLQAAASAWAAGVPWAEALDISQNAIARASPKPKPLPKANARPKAKGKAKGSGKGR